MVRWTNWKTVALHGRMRPPVLLSTEENRRQGKHLTWPLLGSERDLLHSVSK